MSAIGHAAPARGTGRAGRPTAADLGGLPDAPIESSVPFAIPKDDGKSREDRPMEEQLGWEGRPSQITNLLLFIVCALTFWAVLPIFVGLWKWLVVRFTNYQLTTERLTIATGVLSRRTEELELYRVKDTAFAQPFFLRIFGLGNVILRTSDRSHPVVVLKAIHDGKMLRENIRGYVEKMRDVKKVRELDGLS